MIDEVRPHILHGNLDRAGLELLLSFTAVIFIDSKVEACLSRGESQTLIPYLPPAYVRHYATRPDRPYTLNTFITSSPKWLMTLTAIRPLLGRSKGRETSR